MRRKVSLLVILAFVTTLAIINNGCSRSDGEDSESVEDSIDFDLNNANLKERLGKDDGYAFAIFYGADIHGSLETCG